MLFNWIFNLFRKKISKLTKKIENKKYLKNFSSQRARHCDNQSEREREKREKENKHMISVY